VRRKTHFLLLYVLQVPIPDHMDMYHLHQEAEPSDRTALEAVVDHVKEEIERLNKQVKIWVLMEGVGGFEGRAPF
jgi:ATP-binding cassette subfamily F protein 2